jgi:hypothetical protein
MKSTQLSIILQFMPMHCNRNVPFWFVDQSRVYICDLFTCATYPPPYSAMLAEEDKLRRSSWRLCNVFRKINEVWKIVACRLYSEKVRQILSVWWEQTGHRKGIFEGWVFCPRGSINKSAKYQLSTRWRFAIILTYLQNFLYSGKLKQELTVQLFILLSFACIFLEKHFIRMEISGNFLKLHQIDPSIISIII